MDFAKCLVDDGYFDEMEKAFKECLNTIKYPSVEDAMMQCHHWILNYHSISENHSEQNKYF